MRDETQEITTMFTDFQERFTEWLKHKPTGKFSIEIPVNEGGMRGKPEIGIREKV